ncbi:unnamed protein product [Caenorhabditis auriculariae]|uniref:Uncharacterized protein n=1 Tax=Caenorhabditis auriculariae TaxID=2777116 RepID=A0A8S1H8R3_9PELO|nr:unnamed protein product [Caenorhabditis auriculariae]
MAFGGLLEGFLEEKSFGSERKQRPRPHSLVQRRFSTAGEANVERGALKKMSVVSVDASSPRNSWQR